MNKVAAIKNAFKKRENISTLMPERLAIESIIGNSGGHCIKGAVYAKYCIPSPAAMVLAACMYATESDETPAPKEFVP